MSISNNPFSTLFQDLPLPCGLVLPNRLAKAAMEESLAEPGPRRRGLAFDR